MRDLINQLTATLGINFCLQYKDPELNYELCNLTDINELHEKTIVKVIPVLDVVSTSDEIQSDTLSSADTEIFIC